jgi:hypothetical protein
MTAKIELAPGWAVVRGWGHVQGCEGRLVAHFDAQGRLANIQLPDFQGVGLRVTEIPAGPFARAEQALSRGYDPDPTVLEAKLAQHGVPQAVRAYIAGLVAEKRRTRQQQARHRPRRRPESTPMNVLNATRSPGLGLMLEVLLHVSRGMPVGRAISAVAKAHRKSASSVRQQIGPILKYKELV